MHTVQKISATFLTIVALLAIFVYGIAVGDFKLAPYPLFKTAYEELKKTQEQIGVIATKINVDTEKLPVYFKRARRNTPPLIYEADKAHPGVNLITRVIEGPELAVDLLDMEGTVIHSWEVDWFEVWPDAEHIPPIFLPKSKPGTHIHGAVVMEDGSLIFNYEHLGLVRLSRESEILWRLPYRTHHSVHKHTDGNIWVSGQIQVTEKDPLYPGRKVPHDKYTILEINPENGAILNEWKVDKILHDSGYGNLLYLAPVKTGGLMPVTDDRLHLNDVEPFPSNMEEGFFARGDILVSLRNISTVFVFSKATGKIKYITTGIFSQQHDPDFIDGNRFSVFDNNTRRFGAGSPVHSRIVTISAPDSKIEVVFEGSKEQKFHTSFMGKHQTLPNGNILISESLLGRAFEVNPDGEIVWQYVNHITDKVVGLVEEVSRYPEGFAGFSGESKAGAATLSN